MGFCFKKNTDPPVTLTMKRPFVNKFPRFTPFTFCLCLSTTLYVAPKRHVFRVQMWFKLTKNPCSLAVRSTISVPTQTLSLLSAETPGFFMTSGRLVTPEEYVRENSFASSQMCLSRRGSRCHSIYVRTTGTPTGSHTFICHPGHIRRSPSEAGGSCEDGKPVRCGAVRANKKPLSHFHTPTHTVTHFPSRTQTRVHRNYHLQDVMMWLYYIDPACRRLPPIMRRDEWDQREERHAGANVRFCY